MKDRSINIWQAGIFLFIIIFANKILVLPSLLYSGANIEGMFCYLISFLLEIGLITLFIFLKRKYPTYSFSKLVKEKLGVITLKIVYVLIAFFFFCKLILIYNVTYIFFKDLIYKSSGNFLFLICLLPIVNYLAVCDLRSFGRTVQLFFPIIFIILLFCVITSFIGIEGMPLFFQSNVSDVFLTTIKHTTAFGDVIFLFLFMDKIEYKKGDGRKLFFLSLLAMIFVCLIMLAFYFSYTYTSFMHPYAIFEILGNVKDYGGLGRIDVVAVILVMILTYLQMGIYLKCFTLSFHVVFPKLSDAYALTTFNGVFLILVFLLIRNLERTITYGENFLPYLSLISFVLIPLCVIVFLVMRRKKNGKD